VGKGYILAVLFSVMAMGAGSAQAAATQASTPDDGIVVAYAVHPEAPKAEICLSLASPLDIKDRAAILSQLDVSLNGKKQKLSVTDLSLTASELCVQNLKHRVRYDLVMNPSAEDRRQKRVQPYELRFDVPDRKPVLDFVRSGRQDALPRHVRQQDAAASETELLHSGMAHVVRSINVLATHLTLYRIKDRAAFAGAWQQFRQINLSPSESLTFAKTHGHQVFESDLVFGEAPNEEQTLVAPLPADETLEQGLYYLAAMPRGKTGNDPALLTGQWFLVSDVHLSALRMEGGVQIFATSGQMEMKPAAQVHVSVLGRDGRMLAEGMTGADGGLYLPLEPQDMKAAFVATVEVDSGAVDIVDLSTSHDLLPPDLAVQASMALDREAYASGETAVLTLYAQDQAGKMLDMGNTVIKVLRSDRRIYRTLPLPEQAAGVTTLAVPLPVLGRNVTWKLVWGRKDGTTLATLALPVKSHERVSQAKPKEEGESALRADESGSVPFKIMSGLEIKPLFGEKAFAENSLAAFSVTLRDSNGHRRAQDNLYYHIYEEGRSFEWFASEGHWDYKPLPNQRRIGGGALALSATDDTVVTWPVTAGHYVFEITNAEGVVVARRTFDAGRYVNNPAPKEDSRLRLSSPGTRLDVGANNPLTITLAKPAMVSMVVADGRVRQTLHKEMKAGDTVVEIKPAADWGQQVMVHVEARFSGAAKPAQSEQKLMIRRGDDDLVFKLVPPSGFRAGGPAELAVQAASVQEKRPTSVQGIVTFTRPSGQPYIQPLVLPASQVGADGKASLAFALPDGEAEATVRLTAWNERQFGTTALHVLVRPLVSISGKAPQQVAIGQRVTLPVTISNDEGPAGSYDIALSVPEGVEIKGKVADKIKLVKGGKVPLSIGLVANRWVDGSVALTLSYEGKAVAHGQWLLSAKPDKLPVFTSTTQNLEPQQSLSLAAPAACSAPLCRFALVVPGSLPDVETLLWPYVDMAAKTTVDLSLWLEAARLWGDSLALAGFISPERLELLRTARREIIQTRQNVDGGFSAQKEGDPSDLVSTAAAMVLLAGRVEPATDLAAEWLALKLQNTWFDEEERDDRAIAFAAMAKAGQVDPSGLRYFAQTSLDKALKPVSMAALAYGLGVIGDDAASKAWFDKAKVGLATLGRADTLPVLYWMAQVPKVDGSTLFDGLANADKNVPFEGHDALLYLAAQAYRAEAAGTWRLAVGGKEDKYVGLHPMVLTEKGAELKNLSDKRLTILQLMEKKD